MAKTIMTTLRLYSDEAGEHFNWALLDNADQVISTGIDHMPQATRCDVIVPAARVLLTRAKIPKTSKWRQSALLAFAVEEQLLTEPEMNHVAVGEHFSDGSTALAVIDKAWLIHLLDQLQTHGLHPNRVMPETLLPRLAPLCWVLVWDGVCGFLRTGNCSGIALDGDASCLLIGLRLAVHEAVAPPKIICHLLNGAMPDLKKWSTLLGVEIELGSAWDWRKSELVSPSPMNLLQGQLGVKQIDLSWLPQLRPALIMLCLMLAVQFFGIVADWMILAREKTHLNLEMTQLFRTSFPGAGMVVDAPLQMDRKLSELRHAAGLQAGGDYLPLLSKVAPQLATLPQGALKTIDYETGQLSFSVELNGQGIAHSILKTLQSSGLTVVLDKLTPAATSGSNVTAYFVVSSEDL